MKPEGGHPAIFAGNRPDRPSSRRPRPGPYGAPSRTTPAAPVGNDPIGRRRILFVAPGGRRKAVRLGKTDRESAEAIARHAEAPVAAKLAGQPVPRDTAGRLASFGDALKGKPAGVGLADAPAKTTLGELPGATPGSARTSSRPPPPEGWPPPGRNRTAFFGPDKPPRATTPGDGGQFEARRPTQELAAATVAERLSFARTFPRVARRHELTDDSPLAAVAIPAADVSARQRFIGRGTASNLLAVADPIWRTTIALARLGGLRAPPGILSRGWRHVGRGRGRLPVPWPRTGRYDGKGGRAVRLFADRLPPLRAAGGRAEPGRTHVGGGRHQATASRPKGWEHCHLRPAFERLIGHAGVARWPRRFHNLRSSRAPDLLEAFPGRVGAGRMGHDVKVGLKHYAQTTDGRFDRAAGGAQRGARAGQNRARQPAAASAPSRRPTAEVAVQTGGCDWLRLGAGRRTNDERRGRDSNPR